MYVFKPVVETDEYYLINKDGKEFKIEKSICQNTIKPNTLKSETEIDSRTEKLIFPYQINDGEKDLFDQNKKVLQIINESDLKNNYPYTYKYFSSQRNILSLRDKGERKYEEWYAYGRNQALTLDGYKLLFPYISSAPCFVFTKDKELLFYNGYAILSDSIKKLKVLQKILMSEVFWYYIQNVSKPYTGSFFSLAKNYVKNFGICHLTQDEEKELLGFNNQSEIDEFLLSKYDIRLDD